MCARSGRRIWGCLSSCGTDGGSSGSGNRMIEGSMGLRPTPQNQFFLYPLSVARPSPDQSPLPPSALRPPTSNPATTHNPQHHPGIAHLPTALIRQRQRNHTIIMIPSRRIIADMPRRTDFILVPLHLRGTKRLPAIMIVITKLVTNCDHLIGK